MEEPFRTARICSIGPAEDCDGAILREFVFHRMAQRSPGRAPTAAQQRSKMARRSAK